jgi:hypothetical protein
MLSSNWSSEAPAKQKFWKLSNGVWREPAKRGRFMCRLNFQYGAKWLDKYYATKQVAPVAIEEQNEIVVITVYVFYF